MNAVASGAVTISAVIFQESIGDDCKWVAQGLEYDICAQGNTIPDAMKAFNLAVVSNMAVSLELNGELLKGVPAAPSRFWELYKEAAALAPKETTPVRMAKPMPRPVTEFRVAA